MPPHIVSPLWLGLWNSASLSSPIPAPIIFFPIRRIFADQPANPHEPQRSNLGRSSVPVHVPGILNPNTGGLNLYGGLSVHICDPVLNSDSNVRVQYAWDVYCGCKGQLAPDPTVVAVTTYAGANKISRAPLSGNRSMM